MKVNNYLKKELHELIKADENIFDFIQEYAFDGMWYADLEKTEEEWVNPKFWAVLGYDHTEMPHKSSAREEIIQCEDYKLATEGFLEQFKNTDHSYQKIRYNHKNGSTVWMRCQGKLIRNKDGEPIRLLVATQNITEPHTNELEKEELIKRLNYALDASGDGIWDWNPKTGVTVFSKAWAEMLGHREGDFPALATEWSDRLHPDDAEWVYEEIDQVTQTPKNGDTFSHEYRFRNKAGEYLWILNKAKVVERDEKGKAVRVVGTHTNITEQKRNQLRISESEEQKSAIIKSMGDLFFVLDKELTFVEIHNPVKEDLYLTPENFLGKNLDSIGFPEPAFGIIKTALIDCLKTNNLQKVSYYLDMEPCRQWFEARISSLKNSKGIATGLTCIARNISEDVKKEAEIDAISKEIKDITDAVNENSLVSITDKKGNIIKANERFCEISGYTESELIGENHNIINSKYHSKAFWSNVWKTIAAGKLWKGEIKNRAKDGTEYWVSSIIQPIISTSGEIVKYLSIRQDITERKNAELALEKSERFLIQTNQVAQVGGWDFDNLTGEINWSDALCDIFEVPPGFAPTYEQLANFYTTESWIKLEKAIQEATMDGTGYDLELEVTTGKGAKCWLRTIGNSEFKDGKCVRLFGVAQNISERKFAELANLNSEKRLTSIFENAPVFIFELDANFNYTFLNKIQPGLKLKDIIGKNVFDFVLKPFREAYGNLYYKAVETRSPQSAEIPGLGIDGENAWYHVTIKPSYHNGKVNGFLGISSDITAQKLAEIELRESELLLSLATQAGGVGVWDWDIPSNILNWDDQMFSMYGTKREEFPNAYEAWVKGLHEADRVRGDREIEMAIKGEKEFNTEFRIQHPDGEMRNIRALATVIRDEEGNALRMIGTNWDITKEKEAIKQIEEAKVQAEKASKAKSEFLANMSHEIRTPLNGVIGFTDLLKSTPLSSTQQQYVNNANVSGHTLLGIIDDILDFSKIEAGKLELEIIKTDLFKLLENSIDIVKLAAEDKGLELLLNIDPDIPQFANIDPVRIKQILANLLGNAIKFTQSGEVELKVRYRALGGEQGKLSFSVRDTGIGITEVQKEKLFKAFSQADSSTTRKFGGTGLGLIISQTIAEKMGSKININNAQDKGSTFFFDITTNFEVGEDGDIPQIKNLKRCLIIDDNAGNRTILSDMLNQWQIESDCCENGFEAIKKIVPNQKSYDAIICDYDMPYMNGMDTIRMIKDKLKQSTEKHSVILLHSSMEDLKLDQECKELEISFRLNKPVKRQDLFRNLLKLDQQEMELAPQTVSVPAALDDKTKEKNKILLVEDVTLNMMLAKAIISGLAPGAEIFEAKNGLEAIQQFKSINPDLIFMDAHMPDLDGIEATKQIRALEANSEKPVPIIALTAGTLKVEKDKCIDAGMDEFLTKPLEPQKIQLILNKYSLQRKKNIPTMEDAATEHEIHFGYNGLLKNLGYKMEKVHKLLSKVLTDMPATFDRLELAFDEMDVTKINMVSHSIKGWSASMGFYHLADITEKMEKESKDNGLQNMNVLFAELKEEWKILENILMQKIEE